MQYKQLWEFFTQKVDVAAKSLYIASNAGIFPTFRWFRWCRLVSRGVAKLSTKEIFMNKHFAVAVLTSIALSFSGLAFARGGGGGGGGKGGAGAQGVGAGQRGGQGAAATGIQARDQVRDPATHPVTP